LRSVEAEARGGAAPDTGAAVSVALVNNMPDSAFEETEAQFRHALTAQYPADTVQLELYTITEIPRSPTLAPMIESRYRGLDALWTRPPKALIVTGTEPTRAHLSDEPCWPYLARLLDWAAAAVPTTFLSCLTAHASLLLFDGIERQRRSRKCSGVYIGAVEIGHEPLTHGLPSCVPVPHSRLNEVPDSALVEAGYDILIGSGSSGAGWSVAARRHVDGLFVLCQGHPEYSTLTSEKGKSGQRRPGSVSRALARRAN
jgi:homoserine O-succinyltransferase/O-acetyltransferase